MKQIVVKIETVTVTDDNDGFCNNAPVKVGEVAVFHTSGNPAVGDTVDVAGAIEIAGILGWGQFKATGKVVFIP
jgi:hypothetical protein